MNATGATLVFSVSFAAMGLAGAYVGAAQRGFGMSIGPALLILALTLPPGAFAFWFGARRVRHKWYSALISGVIAFAVALPTLGALNPLLSLWLMLVATDVAIAAVGFWLGRMPLFPEVANETRRSDLNATPTDQNMWVAVLIVGLTFLAAGGFTVFNQWPELSLYAILVAVSGALLVALSLWAPITVIRVILRVLSFGLWR